MAFDHLTLQTADTFYLNSVEHSPSDLHPKDPTIAPVVHQSLADPVVRSQKKTSCQPCISATSDDYGMIALRLLDLSRGGLFSLSFLCRVALESEPARLTNVNVGRKYGA